MPRPRLVDQLPGEAGPLPRLVLVCAPAGFGKTTLLGQWALPVLLRLIGVDHGVTVPRLRVPAGLLRRLPATLTRADPETVSFLSADRYPTGPAETIARQNGLTHADVGESLRRWSRYLSSSSSPTRIRPGRTTSA